MSRISTSLWRVVTAATLISAGVAPALAQPTGAVTFQFPLQKTTAESGVSDTSGIVSGSGSIEQWFAKDRGRIFYEVSLDRFSTTDAFGTWLHNAGGMRTFALGGANVNAGGAYFWRANSGAWADAGFRGFNLQSTIDRTLAHGTLSASYNLYNRNFSDAPELDQLEQFGHVRGLASFQTKTTVTGTVGVGWKRYDGEAVESIDAPTSLGASRGRGRGTLGLEPISAGGSTHEAAVRTLWFWNARVAQSLDDRTGVWLEREERRASGDAPPALVWTPPLFYDDGVYDDPYVVEKRTWRAGAKHAFTRGDELAFSIDRSLRGYDGLYVLDDDGAETSLRLDTLLRTGVNAAMVLRSTPAADVLLLAGYSYVMNTSNDPMETYRSHIASLGLSLRF